MHCGKSWSSSYPEPLAPSRQAYCARRLAAGTYLEDLGLVQMKVTRRPANDSDTAFARSAHHQGFRDVVIRQFGTWDEILQDGMFEKDWSSHEFDILLCDGVPCGYVSVEQHPDYSYVRELVILLEHQGRGIGSAFLRGVIKEAQSRQVSVKLGVLRKSRALKLYQRLGFHQYDRTKTHILMEWHDSSSL